MTESQRSIASLANLKGYKALMAEFVAPNRESALDRLKVAKTETEILDAALEYRAWVKVVEILEKTPQQFVEIAKEEGDAIYG